MTAVEQAHREHAARLLALLTRELRSLDLAEDALQEAYAAAVTDWGRLGVPASPAGWLLTVARRRAADRLRRDAVLARKLPLLAVDPVDPVADEPGEPAAIPDERLRLVFTCCHPALSPEARLALTLRYVAGLATPEVARLCLVPEATMAARITRAKRKIAAAGIPYRVPERAELAGRLGSVLAVVYLVFTEGYAPTHGTAVVRADVAAEAIRLGRVLAELLPADPEVRGLLALMLLGHARRHARRDGSGGLVLLADQDRSRWRRDEIAEGLRLLAAPAVAPAGPYRLQALIAAEHARAQRAEDTDWAAIAARYAELEAVTGSPVVRLNRAVAVAEASGPEAGLRLLDGLDEQLPRYHLLPAARAALLRRLGRDADAAREYAAALALVRNDAERAFLELQQAELPK